MSVVEFWERLTTWRSPESRVNWPCILPSPERERCWTLSLFPACVDKSDENLQEKMSIGNSCCVNQGFCSHPPPTSRSWWRHCWFYMNTVFIVPHIPYNPLIHQYYPYREEKLWPVIEDTNNFQKMPKIAPWRDFPVSFDNGFGKFRSFCARICWICELPPSWHPVYRQKRTVVYQRHTDMKDEMVGVLSWRHIAMLISVV